MGEAACDLVNFGAEMVNSEDTIFDILHFVFPAVTFHMLYQFAATDAVRRIKGAKNLAANASWTRLQTTLRKSLGDSDSPQSFSEAVQKAFDHFDLNKSGFITIDEMQVAMQSIGGSDFSTEDASAMIEELTGGD